MTGYRVYEKMPPIIRALAMCALLLACLICRPPSAIAQGVSQPSAAEVKAALLFNFARYVEWPKSFLPDQAEEILFGVVGAAEDTLTLERMVAGKTISGRRIVLKTFQGADDVIPTHILFFTIKDPSLTKQILNRLPDYIVTVGDLPGFLEMGGMINFTKNNDNIRFEMNLRAVNKGGLKISSALTRLADAVIK